MSTFRVWKTPKPVTVDTNLINAINMFKEGICQSKKSEKFAILQDIIKREL